MPNELLWLLYLIFDLTLAVLVFRTLGKHGLIGLVVTEIILSNILVTKQVVLFGITSTLGNITYATIFFATDILSELYGKKEAQKAVWVGFVTSVLSLVILFFGVLLKPAPTDRAHVHLSFFLPQLSRILLASWSAYIISQNHDIWAFHFWKRKTKGRFLWFRNNASTMVSQWIDTIIFVTLAFWGSYPLRIFFHLLISTYFFKWVIAAFDTPFIYIATWWAKKSGLAGLPEPVRS